MKNLTCHTLTSGYMCLFRSLLKNKKLAGISLVNCGVRDEGANELAKVMYSTVKMTPSEVLDWRKLRMELIASNSSLQLTIQPTKQKRPGSEASSDTGKRRGGKRGEKNEKDKKDKKRKATSTIGSVEPKITPNIPDPTVPDETGVKRSGGNMFIPGNQTIYSINLSNNQVIVILLYTPFFAYVLRFFAFLSFFA